MNSIIVVTVGLSALVVAGVVAWQFWFKSLTPTESLLDLADAIAKKDDRRFLRHLSPQGAADFRKNIGSLSKLREFMISAEPAQARMEADALFRQVEQAFSQARIDRQAKSIGLNVSFGAFEIDPSRLTLEFQGEAVSGSTATVDGTLLLLSRTRTWSGPFRLEMTPAGTVWSISCLIVGDKQHFPARCSDLPFQGFFFKNPQITAFRLQGADDLAAVLPPNLLRSPIAANETRAVGSVRAINTASQQYSSFYGNGFPPSLHSLGPVTGGGANCNAADLIDQVLAAGTKSGYNFAYIPGAPVTFAPPGCAIAGATSYTITATPVTVGSTGQRSFCTDESRVIRQDSTGAAIPPGGCGHWLALIAQ